MSKHTPAPWQTSGKSNSRTVILHAEGFVAYTCTPRNYDQSRQEGESWLSMYQRTQPDRDAIEQEQEANARLIAAAPELLDVLLFIKRGLDSGHIKAPPFLDFSNPNAENLELQHPQALVNAVIKKAIGE